MIIEPEAVIATHLNHILLRFSGELISQDDVQSLLDNLSKVNPQLVQSVVPKLIPLHHLTLILRNLLVERVPISDLKKILEALSNLSEKKLSPDELSEAVLGEASLPGQSPPPGGRFVSSVSVCAQCHSCQVSHAMDQVGMNLGESKGICGKQKESGSRLTESA